LHQNNPDPQILLKPAPWQLTGDGFILLYWFSKRFLLQNGFIPQNLIDSFRGGPSVVALVNYHHSDVGPYYELLFIPGRFDYAGRQFSSVTKIYVSTEASVVNGRKNWAIPKETADFEWDANSEGFESVRLACNKGQPFAYFVLKPAGPTLPVSSLLIPSGYQTLLQPINTHLLFTKLQSSGKVRIARCLETNSDSNYFPNLAQGRLLGALKVSSFNMTFPVARTSPQVG
jgi:hypothetical protein